MLMLRSLKSKKKENKVVVMPVRFLKGEREINSKSFPFNFETRKKMIESVFGDSVTISQKFEQWSIINLF